MTQFVNIWLPHHEHWWVSWIFQLQTDISDQEALNSVIHTNGHSPVVENNKVIVHAAGRISHYWLEWACSCHPILGIEKLLPLSKQRIRSQMQQADPPLPPPLSTHTHSHRPWLIAGAWAKLTDEGARWMSVLLGGVCVCVSGGGGRFCDLTRLLFRDPHLNLDLKENYRLSN